jgi:hypothetical protein
MVDHRPPAVGRHVSTDDGTAVDVALPGDAPEPGELPASGRRRLLAPVIAAVSIALILLLLTDRPSDPGAVDAPDVTPLDPSIVEELPLGWPAQGTLAENGQALTDAEAAWRTAAVTAGTTDAPGLYVSTIWAGEIDDRAYALLESTVPGGEGRLAQLSAVRSPSSTDWSVDRVVTVYSEPPFLVLDTSLNDEPRGSVRIVPDPSLLEQGLRFNRVVSGRYEQLAMRPDGISEQVLLADSATDVIALRGAGAAATVASASLVSSTALVPEASSLRFVRPHWGGLGTTTAQDYLDALAALRATGRSHAWVYIAGSSTDGQRHVSLVAVWPFYEGWPDVVTVATAAGDQRVSQPRATTFGQEVVVGQVTVDDSDVVIAAASPRADRVTILLEGMAASEGSRVATAVIPAGTGRPVTAEAYRADGTVLARAGLTPDAQAPAAVSTD